MREDTQALSILDTFKSAGIDPLQYTPLDRIEFARKLTSYIGAETHRLDQYIGKEVDVIGCIVHNATVKHEVLIDGEPQEELINAVRTVFKCVDKHGELFNIGAVSIAIEQFTKEVLLPLFGVGDWLDDEGNPFKVRIKVIQVSKGENRTYSLQVV